MIRHTSEIRVRYADTDQMKNVYYGKYFEYFEQGRSDFMRWMGLPYGELERQGFLLPVIEAFARYRRPARYDDLLLIETRLLEQPAARIRLEYSVLREGESEVLVEGYTVHSFVKASSSKPTRAPEQFLKAINEKFDV
jgi:acyl-CoA thioester hydrolase